MGRKTSADQIVQIAGGAAAVALAGYLYVSYTYFNETPVGCMDGYARAVRFSLHNAEGAPLSMIELQARSGREEEGLMQNARIVDTQSAQMARVLEVKLGRADDTDPQSAVGVNFPWRPDGGQGATSACLRYSVRLPEGIELPTGGLLPGLFGGVTPDRVAQAGEAGFALRTRWNKDGETQLVAEAKAVAENGRLVVGPPRPVRLARGRWVTLEQELKLNTPGASDGAVHVWLDGEKVIEKTGLQLREDDKIGVDGVAVTIGLAGKAPDVPASEATLQITPIDYGWK